MIGRNAAAFGCPQLNLFISDTLEGMLKAMPDPRHTHIHGLLRAVAHIYGSEQTINSVAMARRWVLRRLSWSTSQVFDELRKRVAPRKLVDKSAIYSQNEKCLERIQNAYPDAYYVHVIEHPPTSGASIASAEGAEPSAGDRLQSLNAQHLVAKAIDHVMPERLAVMRIESLLDDPRGELSKLCAQLDLATDEAAVTEMLHPENSPFATLGPVGANLGDDPAFLRDPTFPPVPALQGSRGYSKPSGIIAEMPPLIALSSETSKQAAVAKPRKNTPTTDQFGQRLSLQDFEPLDIPSLNPAIRTSQAMAWFEGKVILGTGRAPLGFLGRRTAQSGPRLGARMETGGSDAYGAQIIVFDPKTRQWQKVYESPVITGRDGKLRARDRSMRARLVCQTIKDSKPCLYVGMGSLEGGVNFLRSEDGIEYQECKGSGFNLDADVPSVRSMAFLDGKLFSTPTGMNYGRGLWDDNFTDFPMVFQATDPMAGDWTAVSEPGFGNPENRSINELEVFNGCLYAATHNPRQGFELWKTDACGDPPYRWTKILERGAWRGALNAIAVAMAVYKNALYLSACILRQGQGGLHLDHYGPFPAELMRIYPDDSWDIITGSPRFTPHGLKRPISGLTGGFGDRYLYNFWRFAIQDETLYLGTSGWKWMPTYLRNRGDLSDAQLQRLRAETEDYHPGEYSLWCTDDGVNWEAITTTGFPGSSRNNYGIRELQPTPYGLFVAPTGKAGAGHGGGLELWWGHKT